MTSTAQGELKQNPKTPVASRFRCTIPKPNKLLPDSQILTLLCSNLGEKYWEMTSTAQGELKQNPKTPVASRFSMRQKIAEHRKSLPIASGASYFTYIPYSYLRLDVRGD
ncbi:hypothetical protein F2Q70_00014784 [Brassica cretica]|uniref:Uncharacterized protein n=1 Tax=Brassica cretica TaxID=69181 RepID=A0A8S9I2Q0_BRACR|nr:hypothetical protein F2Q70_00014784 [Brassica cretica]